MRLEVARIIAVDALAQYLFHRGIASARLGRDRDRPLRRGPLAGGAHLALGVERVRRPGAGVDAGQRH